MKLWGLWRIMDFCWDGKGALAWTKHKKKVYVPYLFKTKKKAKKFNRKRGVSNKDVTPMDIVFGLASANTTKDLPKKGKK